MWPLFFSMRAMLATDRIDEEESKLTPRASKQLQPYGNTRSPATRSDSNVPGVDGWVDWVCLDGEAVSIALESLQTDTAPRNQEK